MNAKSRISVLIVGAGPVGLTMAAELARYQIPIRIIDKSSARTDKSKAVTLWSRSLELLDRAGNAEILFQPACGCMPRISLPTASIWRGLISMAFVRPTPSHFRFPNPKPNASWKSAFSRSASESTATSN